MLLALQDREAIHAISPALEAELDRICAAMSNTFEVEHDDQGHHTNIHPSSISLTVNNSQNTVQTPQGGDQSVDTIAAQAGDIIDPSLLTGAGGGGGDVVGPIIATDGDVAIFDGVTGKLIKDGGTTLASILASIASITLGANFFIGPAVQWNAADLAAGTSKTLAVGIGGVIIVPMYLEISSDFTISPGGYLTSRAMQVRYASGSTTTDLLDPSNAAFHNTAVKQWQRIGPTTEMNFTTNDQKGVGVKGVPGGTMTFLGTPPDNNILTARLVYTLVPAI